MIVLLEIALGLIKLTLIITFKRNIQHQTCIFVPQSASWIKTEVSVFLLWKSYF